MNNAKGSDFYWQREEIMYCGNVHPCSSVEGLIRQIEQHILPIKSARNLSGMMLGLWLNKPILDDFSCNAELANQFFYLLNKNNLKIKTLNAFPQREFHGEVIKTQVYQPAWCDLERLKYTLELVDFIKQNSSSFAGDISISTLPLGYKTSWDKIKHQSAITNLKSLATYLSLVKKQNNINIRVCLEMEPDCVLETTDEMVSFFNEDLGSVIKGDFLTHLGVCFDICHQAVMHEDIHHSLATFIDNGIPIGKIQVSNALRFQLNNIKEIEPLLQRYYSSPYLHQVKINNAGETVSFSDLNIDNVSRFPETGEARVHFHLPINQVEISDVLMTTQQSILATLTYLHKLPFKPDLEVETYTWNIIDSSASHDKLNQYLLKELTWLEENLLRLKLLKT